MARDGIKGYNVMIICDEKIPVDDADETQEKGVSSMNYSTRQLKWTHTSSKRHGMFLDHRRIKKKLISAETEDERV